MLDDRKTREEMIQILEYMANSHKPCEKDYDKATEAEKQKEFKNANELHYQIKYLIQFMERLNEDEDITSQNKEK